MTEQQTKPGTFSTQRGFTLLELMIAMAVTLVITGAMFAMVTSAQTSFRREPALADRQMQARIAMDRIQEDILNAGANIGPFGQAFVPATNGVGPLGVYPVGRATYGGGNSDVLELRMQTTDCPSLRPRQAWGGTNPVIGNYAGPNYLLGQDEINALNDAAFPCYNRPGFVLATFLDGQTKIGWRDRAAATTGVNLTSPAAANSQLTAAADRQCSTFPTPGACALPAAPINPPELGWRVAAFSSLDVVRYQIGFDTDGITPSLYRSARGGLTDAGVFQAPAAGLDQWQLIARGVEDFQVRYKIGPPDAVTGIIPDANWTDNAPAVVAANFNTLVRQVEVTVWVRALDQVNLQGENRYANLGLRANLPLTVRGSLITIVTPRAIEATLSTAPSGDANRWQ